MDNPFDGLIPDFNVFGAEFTTWWQKLFGALWAIAIIVAAAYLIWSILSLRRATNNNVPGQADEAKTQAIWAGGALGALVGFGTIIGAIIAVAS
jgi:hypothetical protein